ncbi:Crm, cramped-like (Drosophila) [Nesidiocoris tenuis]|uniref:Crm, cramped-like (Drosophila) n=1 Tax=Nesidiocoris tenuis TaxID=355587 RepID=A0ABN7BDL0_9HEMI|nr:Crm, cramped-like (Drosophila) [Nesidiocoris tenuis]
METPGCAAPVENTELAEEKIPEKLPEKVTPSGIQLRTSARVIKKLKLDQEAALAALNSKKAEEAAKEEAPPPSDEKPQPKRRIIWSHDDKNAFFEALNEHGKNFEEIEKYMAARAKRRSDVSNKNRVRARHFFYRTWHKLAKYVNFPDCIKKSTQELYALINFGEWRKKVGHVVERNAQKLNELIYSGCTQVRVRGKAWRIKTPVCRALRRLNAFEDEGEDLKLPSRITVMITARSNKDAARVQAIAHNTRVKTTLSIDSSIQNITTFLSRRWSAAHGIDSLRVGPKKDAIPAQTNFKCGQVVTSSAVSLLAHERKTCSEGYDKVKALLTQLQIGKTKATLKYQREETAAVSNDTDVNSEVVDPKSLAPSSSSGSEELPGDMRSRIGQLYLMYGKQGMLDLEYWWEEADKENVTDLSKTLPRLISIAKLFHTKTKVECPCGHVCKGSVKVSGSSQSKSQKQQKAAAKKIEAKEKEKDSDAVTFKEPFPPSAFGRPIQPSALPSTSPASEAAVAALRLLQNTRYSQRPGRRRQNRSVVVQRMLPVLPKPTYPVVMSLNGVTVLPTSSVQPFPSVTSAVNISGPLPTLKKAPLLLPKTEQQSPPAEARPTMSIASSSIQVVPVPEPSQLPCSSTSLDNPSSSIPSPKLASLTALTPASVTTFLQPSDAMASAKSETAESVKKHDLIESFENELDEAPTLDGHTTTLDSIISQLPGVDKTDGTINSFKGILSKKASGTSASDSNGAGDNGNSAAAMLDVTPPTSPSRILKEGESQWLNADVNDFSLSSFLGQLESPMKINGTEDTHMSADMESHFQQLMAESSLDYMAKFADLAAKIVGPSPSSVPP